MALPSSLLFILQILMFSFAITLPVNALADILANVSGIWGDLLPLIGLLVAVFLGLWLVELIVDIFTPHSKKSDWFENDPFLTEEDKTYYRRRSHGRFVSKREIEEDEEDEF